jgi:iron-sulfur cluster insertion protein
MIHITPAAAAKLTELRGVAAPMVRLYHKGRTCCGFRYGMAFQDQVDDDSTVTEVGGVRILTDPSTTAACEGASVDYVETSAGAGFTVRGAAGSAGCTCGGGAAS